VKKSVLMGVLLVGMSCSCFAMWNSPPAKWYHPPAIDPAQQNLFWKASAAGTRVLEKQAQEKQEKNKVEKNPEEKSDFGHALSKQDILPASPTRISRMVGNRASRVYGEPRKMSAKHRMLLFKYTVESGDAALMRVLLGESADFCLAQYSADAAQHEQTELALVAQQLLRSRIHQNKIHQNKQDTTDINISFLLCVAVIRIDCQAALAFLKAGAYISAVMHSLFSRKDVSRYEDGVRFTLLEQDIRELKSRVLKNRGLKAEQPEDGQNNPSHEPVATQQERDRFKWLELEDRGSTPLRYLIHKRECALENVRPIFDTLIQELVQAGADFRASTVYPVEPYVGENGEIQKNYSSVPYVEASDQVQQIIAREELVRECQSK
jgi:hypothetical protein